MSHEKEAAPELSTENRLDAVLYQFVTLYERWSEDRQVAAKQGGDTAELVRLFTEQVKEFKSLEPSVRQDLVSSIQQASVKAIGTIGAEVGKQAVIATDQAAALLNKSAKEAKETLKRYEQELFYSHWVTIGFSFITTIATCLLLVYFLIPRPTLPLTDPQVRDLRGGEIMKLVWPKLSKKEQEHWKELAEKVQ
jgi:hypothetical protein